MSNKGTLYIVAAPSGAGKTSLVQALVERVKNLLISVSYTTRPARPAEADGREYHFIPRQQFQDMVTEDKFLEHARVFGHMYGTSEEWGPGILPVF